MLIAKYLGQAFLVLAILTLAPLACSLFTGNPLVGLRYGTVILILATLGWLSLRLKRPARLQKNEALVISMLAFILAPLFMAYPLSAYGISPLDAVFECVSGMTTTGLSTLGSVEDKPAALLFSRAWMQWSGGLGITVLALALLIAPGTASRQLGFDKREAEDLIGGTRAHARRVLVVYVGMTLAGVLLIWALGAGFFDAVVHTLAAVSTGGFANYDDSLAGLPNAPVRFGIVLLCLGGALPFYAFYGMRYRSWRKAFEDVQLRMLLAACGVVTALLLAFLSLAGDGSLSVHLQEAALMGLSAQTTAGFSTGSVSKLDPASILVLLGSMLIGGGQGSTAGGFKIFRFLVFVRLLQLMLVRVSVSPSTESALRIGRTRMPREELETVVAVVLGYLVTLVTSWLVFLSYGYDPLSSLFEVTSALATAGLSAGITQPDLESPLKVLLCVDMLMGRVETCAFVVLLLPRTWLGRRRSWT